MRRWWWLLLCLPAVGLWSWLGPKPAPVENSAADDPAANNEPGFSSMDAELIEYGSDGAPLYRVNADRIDQTRSDAAVTLLAPRLSYQTATRGQWTLQAGRGELSPDRHHVLFSGDVAISQRQAARAPITIRTPELAMNLVENRADTTQVVAVEWGRATFSARGLHADLNSDRVTFDSETHAVLRH
jgi:LPS export ABC transporter protein LptC